jgi:hypothetical protein
MWGTVSEFTWTAEVQDKGDQDSVWQRLERGTTQKQLTEA